MYIIIVGGGRIGAMTAAELLALGHEVLVIERDAARADHVIDELGSCVVCADGSEGSVLGDQGAARADLLIAVTNEDRDNLVACQVAKHHYGVDEVIARINEPRNEPLFDRLGITAVSTVEAMVSGLLHEAPVPFPKRLMTFRHSRSRLISIAIPKAAPTIGRPVHDITLPEGAAVALIVRKDGAPEVLSPETVLQAEDEVIALARPEHEHRLLEALAGTGP